MCKCEWSGGAHVVISTSFLLNPHTHTHTHIRTHIQIHTHTRTHTHTHTCTDTRGDTHKCMHTHTQFLRGHILLCVVCVSVCVSAFIALIASSLPHERSLFLPPFLSLPLSLSLSLPSFPCLSLAIASDTLI